MTNIIHDSQSTFEEATGGMNIRLADRQAVLDYNAKDAKLTYDLYLNMQTTLPLPEWRYFEEVESRHVLNLFHINYNGVPFNREDANSWTDALTQHLWTLEVEIFRLSNRAFNLSSSSEVSRALYYNEDLKYIDACGAAQVLRPPFKTDQGQDKTTIEALQALQRRVSSFQNPANHDVLRLLDILIRHAELDKAKSQIETLNRFAVGEGHSAVVYPNYAPDARTGRVRCPNPNMLGLSKAFLSKCKTDAVDIPADLKDRSVRQLFQAPDGFEILSVDIDGLDLGVMTHLALELDPEFSWKPFFGSTPHGTIDTHYGVFQLVDPENYAAVFKDVANTMLPEVLTDYWVLKSEPENDTAVDFIHKQDGTHLRIGGIDPKRTKERKKARKRIKELNLGTPYLMGAKTIADKIRQATNDDVSIEDANWLLDRFYKTFPAIRSAQDKVANRIYHHGFVESPFGRRFYADTWDDLNEHRRACVGDDEYEFICRVDGRYWYVRATEWVRGSEEQKVIDDMKLLDKSLILRMRDIRAMTELERHTFRSKGAKLRRRRPGQDTNDQDETGFVLSKAEITHEVDKAVGIKGAGGGHSTDSYAVAKALDWVVAGSYSIPESCIVFYRVRGTSPSSAYFKTYTSLLRSTKRAFPIFSQGVAATVAKLCLTDIRQELERTIQGARVLFFIHDEIVISAPSERAAEAKEMIKGAVERAKEPLRIRFTGSAQVHGRRWYGSGSSQ